MLESLSSLISSNDNKVNHRNSHDDSAAATAPSLLLPASPDCWLQAVRSLQFGSGSIETTGSGGGGHHQGDHEGSSSLTRGTCSHMTSVDQKILGLALSQCHLNDLGRQVFDFTYTEEHEECNQVLTNLLQPPDDTQIANKCLKHLTSDGFHVYTYFFSYVNQICTRLLTEVVASSLVHSSQRAESTLQMLIDQQDSQFGRWNERHEQIMDMYDNLEEKVVEQAEGFGEKLESLETLFEEQKDIWNDEYRRFQEEQQEELNRRQDELILLTQLVRGLRWATSPFGSAWNWIASNEFSFEVVSDMISILQDLLSEWSLQVQEWSSDLMSKLTDACGKTTETVKASVTKTVDGWKASTYDVWNSILNGIQFSYHISEICIYAIGGLFCILLVTVPPSTRWMRRSMVILLSVKMIASIMCLVTLPRKKLGGDRRDAFETDDNVYWSESVVRHGTEMLNEWHFQCQVVVYLIGLVATMLRRCFQTSNMDCYDSDCSQCDERMPDSIFQRDLNATYTSPLQNPPEILRRPHIHQPDPAALVSPHSQRNIQSFRQHDTDSEDDSNPRTQTPLRRHQPDEGIAASVRHTSSSINRSPRLQPREEDIAPSPQIVDPTAEVASTRVTQNTDTSRSSTNNVTKKRPFDAVDSSTNSDENGNIAMNDDNATEDEMTDDEYEDAHQEMEDGPPTKRICH